MKYTKIITIIMALVVSITLHAQDNTFNGTADNNWDNAANWSTGKVPPTHIVQKITIAADCIVSSTNTTDYTFSEGSTFQIESGITFTNNATGTWTMEGSIDNEGTYSGNLVIAGNIEPGDNTSTWTCGDPIIYDGQSYATVAIGTQCWMAENLNIGSTTDVENDQTDNNIIEKYCNNCSTYGGLYQWDEMMQYVTTEPNQGVCPTSWHLPSDDEYKTLEMELGMSQSEADDTGWRGTDEGGKLKETGTSHWSSPNTGATNSSGFTALPGGSRISSGLFAVQGEYAVLWSSTTFITTRRYRVLSYNDMQVGRFKTSIPSGFSVRCVR